MKLPHPRLLGIIAVVALLVSIPAIASAQENPPQRFYGTVEIGGEAPEAGTMVAAIIGNETIGEATTDAMGNYVLTTRSRASYQGQVVNFTIDGEMARQSARWRQGGIDLLNLTVLRGARPVADVFSPLISDGSLVVVWMYHNDTKTWSAFDPRPEAAAINDLTEVSRGDILWVEVSAAESSFQGTTLFGGWNLITLP